MDYKITTDVTAILVDGDLITGSSSDINNALPTVLPGTIIHDAGYSVIKQKGLDGSWTAV